MAETIKEFLIHYIEETYQIKAETPWIKYPDNLVFRHKENQKWFALMLPVNANKIIYGGAKEQIPLLNIKVEENMLGSLILKEGIIPAYHMNKRHWISVFLNGVVPIEEIINLLDISYQLTL